MCSYSWRKFCEGKKLGEGMENKAEVWGEGTPTNWVWSPVRRLCSGILSQFLGAKSLKLPSLKQEPASTSFRKNCLMDKKEHTWWQEEPERTGTFLFKAYLPFRAGGRNSSQGAAAWWAFRSNLETPYSSHFNSRFLRSHHIYNVRSHCPSYLTG